MSNEKRARTSADGRIRELLSLILEGKSLDDGARSILEGLLSLDRDLSQIETDELANTLLEVFAWSRE